MKNKIIFVLISIVIGMCANVFAQDNNYWARQYGSISSVLGGAVVGSHNDNGSIYYNPATLSFTDSIKLSVSSGLYEGSFWKISNGIKTGEAIFSTDAKRFPIAIFPAFNLKKGFKLGLIYLPRLYSNYYLHEGQLDYVDVLHNNSPVSLYSSFDYKNYVNEWWYGLSLSKKLKNHSSIGIIPFVSYRSQRFSYQYGADALLDSANAQYLNTFVQKYVRYYNYKFILKGGYYYTSEKFSFGAAVTAPAFTALSSGTSSARIYLNGYSVINPQASNQYFVADEQVELKANHKYPFTISLGCKLASSKCIYYLSTETFFKINTYNVVDLENRKIQFPIYSNLNSTDLIGVQSASRFMTNVAFGFQYKYRRTKTLSGGFSTDFNSLPKDFTQTGTNVNTSNWDLYHLSIGFDTNIKKIKLSVGIRSSFGYKNDNLQFADIKTAAGDNLLYGDREAKSNYTYGDLSLLLGFNF
ncbi:MAG: hypothetical protein ABI723_25395 [Bacteroidia bacterium]